VLAFDIGAPTGLYYVLHGAGLSNLAALSIAAVLPAMAAVYKLVVKRPDRRDRTSRSRPHVPDPRC
jgi:hypothetical protein